MYGYFLTKWKYCIIDAVQNMTSSYTPTILFFFLCSQCLFSCTILRLLVCFFSAHKLFLVVRVLSAFTPLCKQLETICILSLSNSSQPTISNPTFLLIQTFHPIYYSRANQLASRGRHMIHFFYGEEAKANRRRENKDGGRGEDDVSSRWLRFFPVSFGEREKKWPSSQWYSQTYYK